MLTRDEIEKAAYESLRVTLGSHGFVGSDVVDDLDNDGEEALRVTARFRAGSLPADGKTALGALTALRDDLRKKGEHRFPYLRYEYPDDDIPALSPEDFDA